MKKYLFVILCLCAGLRVLAEDPRYFLEYSTISKWYESKTPLEERYHYLLGKRITVEEDLALLYDDPIEYEQFCSVWDLAAKRWLLHDLSSKGYIYVNDRKDRATRRRYLEMATEVCRDIAKEYRTGETKKINALLSEQIKTFIKTRSEEDRKIYLRTMFLRDRNRYIFDSIFSTITLSEFIEALVSNFPEDPQEMLKFYDRSLLIKSSGTRLSEYVRQVYPRKTELISRLKELEDAEKNEVEKEELPERQTQVKLDKTAQDHLHPVTQDQVFSPWLGFACSAGALFVLGGGLFLWRRRKRSRA